MAASVRESERSGGRPLVDFRVRQALLVRMVDAQRLSGLLIRGGIDASTSPGRFAVDTWLAFYPGLRALYEEQPPDEKRRASAAQTSRHN